MKQFHRFWAFLLCLALLLSLLACTEKTDPVTPSDPTAATDAPVPEDPARQLYENARSAIDNAEDVSLRISVKESTTVGGETFSDSYEQTLTFNGRGTDTLQVYCKNAYGSYAVSTQEYYYDDTVYLIVDDAYNPGTATQNMQYDCKQEDFLTQHYPAVMLDASLYQNITAKEGEKLTTLTMTEPSAAESWVLPDGAEFLSGSGIARIDPEGILHSSEYTVKYQYGNSVIELEISAYISLTVQDIALPERARLFPEVAPLEAIDLYQRAFNRLGDAAKISASSMSFYYSAIHQYAAYDSLTLHLNANDHMFRRRSDSTRINYQEESNENYTAEDLFKDDLYFVVSDDREQLTGTIAWTEARYYSMQHIRQYMYPYLYWQSATVTDLGSTYLIEYQYVDSVAVLLAETACRTLFTDSDEFLAQVSKHKTTTVSGYLAVDKYSGLPTASGIYYIGSYVLNGYEYPLMAQIDIAINAPSLGAYKAITEEMPKEPKPETPATPLFYHVTGDDGEEMWLLGTVHVGDARTAYLPQEIYDAFDSADAAAFEFNIDSFEKQLETDEKLQEKISGYYYYEDGSSAMDHLDKGTYNDAIKFLKASGNYNTNIHYLKPYFWGSMVDNFYLQQGYRLTSEQGVDMRLTDRALAQNKKILEVESAESQLAMMSGFSDELQALLLMQILETDVIASWEELNLMYDTWCAGDEEAMRKYLSADPDELAQMTEEERILYEEYNNAMNLERNRKMLDVAISYLESGETVFFAVGLAHLLVEEGLVDTLRDSGYTVELVTYRE